MASSSIRKRSKSDNQTTNIFTSSVGPFSDHAFLTDYINTDCVYLMILLSNLYKNRSFSSLYQRSKSIGWIQVFRELLHGLKSDDDKSKCKQFILYRLLYQYSTDLSFENEVKKLVEYVTEQLSCPLTPTHRWFNRLDTPLDIYTEIDEWRRLQQDRRLFSKDYHERCSLLILQDRMTEYFLTLLQAPCFDSSKLAQLFNRCLIIITQPSSADCLAVAKYDKSGQNFSAKIGARVICLLDPVRLEHYFELAPILVTLYLKDRHIDPTGDTQKSLLWKQRTIKCNGTGERTFLYFEYSGDDVLQLTKKTMGDKPMYNNQLCQLEFQVTFSLKGYQWQALVTCTSDLFGFCSHPKFYSKFLSKVFLETVKNNFNSSDPDTYLNIMKDHINRLYKRITGVDAKDHTKRFISQELLKVYQTFPEQSTTPFKVDIYENILEEFITHMRFMASHPFLTMMYMDNLFLGMSMNDFDSRLSIQTERRSRLIMRFARPAEQEKPDNPNIIISGHANHRTWTSRISHNDVAEEILKCICAATKDEYRRIEVFHDTPVPFTDFQKYYNFDLNADQSTQTNNQIQSIPLETLLENIAHAEIPPPTTTNQVNGSFAIDLRAQFIGNNNLTADYMEFMRNAHLQWCRSRNVQGSLTHQSRDSFDSSNTDFSDLFG